jgi:phage terminase small subunit
VSGSKLTAKQEKFCKLIVEGKTQYDAYMDVYSVETMSRRAIDREASLLRSNPKIAKRIAALASKIDEKFEVRVSDLLRESARVAYSDVSKIIDPATGRVKLPHELDEDTRRAVSAFEIDDLGRIKYKFWDKNTAQDRLFKFKGLYEKDHSQATAGLTALRDALVGAVVGPDPAAAQPDDDEDVA